MTQPNYSRAAFTAQQHRNSFSAASYSQKYGPPPSAVLPQQQQQQQAGGGGYARRVGMRLPWPCYAMDYATSYGGARGKIAVGSLTDDSSNRMQILGHGLDGELVKEAESGSVLPFPPTKLLWEPTAEGREPGLLATTAEYLRLFTVEPSGTDKPDLIRQHALLGNTKADFPAPLTSFDWNRVDPSLIVTASVDTTCTVWDLNTGQAKTQLIAHDREVFDVAFTCGSTDLFASVGADGSVRLFDLRALEHSTILYECSTASQVASPNPARSSHGSASTELHRTTHAQASAAQTPSPLLRLSACSRDANLLATFHADRQVVQVLDVRQPGQPLLQLQTHAGAINAIAWQPGSRTCLATAADDAQVLLWDLHSSGMMSQAGVAPTAGATATATTAKLREPVMAWQAESEVNNISWQGQGQRLAVCYGRTVQTLKM